MTDSFTLVVVPLVLVLGLSGASAFNLKTREFEPDIFLVSLAIGLSVLVWMGVFPFYILLLSGIILVGLFFKTRGVPGE